MQKYADYIKQIEIDSLWSGRKHVLWNLDRRVNILSGVNGVGKSTIINKVVKGLAAGGEFPSHLLKGVRLSVVPEDAKWIRFDIIRSFDNPVVNQELLNKVGISLVTELDWQLYTLQRKYLDYQVNVGNRIIAALQSGEPDAAEKAQALSEPKKKFQDIVDDLFADTGKTIVRSANEIQLNQMGEVLQPYQLSSGEKQMLVILLGNVSSVKPEQPQKAPFPMLITLSGNVSLVKLLQPWKASLSIFFNFFGMTISSNLSQPLNASLQISSTRSSIS